MKKYLPILLVALTFFAKAQDSSEKFDKINIWIDGVVGSVNADKLAVSGVKLPFASAHSELRSEYAKLTAKATPAEKQDIAAKLSAQWQDKLEKAKDEKESDTPTEYNLIAKDKIVFLTKRSANDMVYVSGDFATDTLVAIEVYNMPKEADGVLTDLKAGDHVKVGFNSTTNEIQVIVRTHEAKK